MAKICLLGDGNVGKTSLRDRFIGKGFSSSYLPTLGADFAFNKVEIESTMGRKEIQFQIWDLAGQQTFNQVRAKYYRGSSGALLVFDVTQTKSLYNLKNWLKDYCNSVETENYSIIVIGNKIDLYTDDNNYASSTIVKQFINEQLNTISNNFYNNITYLETSAKTGVNVNKAFKILGTNILNTLYQYA